MIDVVCKDNNTKIVRLIVPTEADGVDLSDLIWTINVENADKATDSHTPSSVAIKEGKILIDWTIHGIATSVPGITSYQYMGVSESGMVWQNAKMYLNVRDRIEATPSEDEEDTLTDLQKLIVYVNAELENIIEAKDIAINAAERAEEAAKRVENAGGGSGGISEETDPTVPVWAKQPEKPKYTAEEVGAASEKTVEQLSEEVGLQGKAIEDKADKLNVPVYIDTITIEEDVERFGINTEPDGTPYAFKKLVVRITAEPTSAKGNWILYPMGEKLSNSGANVTIPSFPDTEKKIYGMYVCDVYDGFANFYAYKGNHATVFNTFQTTYIAAVDDVIGKLQLTTSTGIAAGTTIEIWAVRA